MWQRYKWTFISLVVCLGMFGIVNLYYNLDHPVREGANMVSRSLGGEGTPNIGGDFSMIDDQGEVFTQEKLKGKYSLIYFGYTFCPDVCPDGLSFMVSAYDDLPQDIQENLQMVFVTIDPDRDTVKEMSAYVAAFHPELIGLTGTKEQVKNIASKYLIYYAKRKHEAAGYLMDHSSYYYLMGPDGKYVQHFADSHQLKMDEFVKGLTEAVRR